MDSQVQATAQDSTSLELLGISVDQEPSSTLLPEDFNPQGLPVWAALFERPDWKSFLTRIRRPTLVDQWNWLIERYLASCTRVGLFPFKHSSAEAERSYVEKFVMSARRAMARLLNDNRFFDHVSIFRASTQFKLTKTSTKIVSVAELFPVRDPTFEEFLQKPYPAMYMRKDGTRSRVYYRKLVTLVGNEVRIEVDMHNPRRATVTLIIDIKAGYPSSTVGPLPSPDETQKLFGRLVWRPAIYSNRFLGTPRIF